MTYTHSTALDACLTARNHAGRGTMFVEKIGADSWQIAGDPPLFAEKYYEVTARALYEISGGTRLDISYRMPAQDAQLQLAI